MNKVKTFNEYHKLNEEFKRKDISDFFKIIQLRKKLKELDWDENDDVTKLFDYIYPKDELDDDIKHLSIDNMIDILYKVGKMNHIPELEFDEKDNDVKIEGEIIYDEDDEEL